MDFEYNIINKLELRMKELVSVIIPVFNVEKYIEISLDSILNQTYENFEVIIVNDCSTDSSKKICEKYVEKDSRIVFVDKSENRINRGASYARNCGLDIAKGKYIAFLDSDDYVEPEFLHTLVSLLENFNCDLSGCSVIRETFGEPKNINDKSTINLLSNVESMQNILTSNIFDNGYVCNKLFKREILGDMRFNEKILYIEDLPFVYNYLKKCENSCVYSNRVLYHYIRNPTGSTKRKFNIGKLTALKTMECIIKDCKKNMPQILKHARGLYCLINLEILYYTLRDRYKSRELRKNLKKNISVNLKYLTKTKLFHLYKRILVPIANLASKFIA